MRECIDYDVAKDINEIIGERVRGRKKAFKVGLASLCMCVAGGLRQLGDQTTYIEVVTLLADLYFHGLPAKPKQKRRLH